MRICQTNINVKLQIYIYSGIATMNFKPAHITAGFGNPNRLGLSSVSRVNQSHRKSMIGDQNNMGEIQFMLENERKKFREAKEKFYNDLDNQRKLRIQFENKLIKMKEEFSRKQITISELEFKVNNLYHQNQDLAIQNQRLSTELARLEDVYGGKVHELQTQLALETKNYDDMANQYNTQFQKFKREGQQYVEHLQFQSERKIKSLQEKLKAAQTAKKDIGMEHKKLNDILISNKLAFEQQVRQLKNRQREQQAKKVQQMAKSYEQKLKLMDDAKELISKKNNDLLRALQEKDREIQDLQNQRDQQVSRLGQQNSDQSQQLNHLNYLVNKLKAQISEKDMVLGRGFNSNDQQIQGLKQQIQNKKQQNFQLASTVKDLRISLKQSENQSEKKRRDLVQKLSYYEAQARKYKEQYQRICQNLKSRINQTINNVSFKK